MSDSTVSIAISVIQDLAYTVVFLICVAASYLTLQQPKVKAWLEGTGVLVHVVVFIVLAALLSMAVNPIISDLFAFPHGLINQANGFSVSVQCLGGVLGLAGLVVGGWLLAGRSKAGK
jgi:hypothetical protein